MRAAVFSKSFFDLRFVLKMRYKTAEVEEVKQFFRAALALALRLCCEGIEGLGGGVCLGFGGKEGVEVLCAMSAFVGTSVFGRGGSRQLVCQPRGNGGRGVGRFVMMYVFLNSEHV